MTVASAVGASARTIRVLHVTLVLGVVALVGAFVLLHQLGLGPALEVDPDVAALVAYLMSGLAAVLVVLGLLVLRSRVTVRRGSQSVDEYWATTSTTAQVVRVFLVLEAAGTLAAIGFFFTGEIVAVMTAMAAVFALLMCSPSVFSRP